MHAYTQGRGRISFTDADRAFIFEDGNTDPDSERIFGSFQRREVDESVFVPYLTTLHVLLQVAIGLTIMKLIPSYYSGISKSKVTKKVKNSSPSGSVSIFWANVFFAITLDILFFGIDLYLIISVYGGVESAIDEIITSTNRSTLETVFAFGMLGTLVTFILVCLQFFVAAGIPKNTELYIPGLLRLLCCFFPCQCKKLGGDFWRKVVQTLAVWFLMVFLQLVAGSVIPYLVLAIVNPVPSVTFLALGTSTLFCLIIFVASLIHVSIQLKKSSCYHKIVAVAQGLVFIVFLGLVALTVIIYQGVIQSGTSTGFISGIALSLIPSGIIAVLGVAVKFKLLSDTDEEDDPKEHQNQSFFNLASGLIRHQLTTKQTRQARKLRNIIGHQVSQFKSDTVDHSDHPETNNTGVELLKEVDTNEQGDQDDISSRKEVDMSKESQDDQGELSNTDKELDYSRTRMKKISKVEFECPINDDEIDSGNSSGSGSDAKESGLKDTPTLVVPVEIVSKTNPSELEVKLDNDDGDLGNNSSDDKKTSDFKDTTTSSEFEVKYKHEPEPLVVTIDFT